MPMEIVVQKQFDHVTDRKCGSCTACCTWLGIEELKNFTGQKCKYLRGPAYAHKRCGIYINRPSACSEYECLWKSGWGLAEWQPHKSGILLTPYDNDYGTIAITMNIFDMVKAEPYINVISSQLLLLPNVSEVRVINIIGNKALLYKNGNIYNCRLLPAESFKSLTFTHDDEPVGHYQVG